LANRESAIVDVNTLAIYLVEDHPGNKFVTHELEKGLKGQYVPIILDNIPIRAFWIMTRTWGCDKAEGEKAIRHFLDAYHTIEYYSIDKKTIHQAFDLARELHHDVFDTIYLSAAIQIGASAIITTDTDFQRLCQRKKLRYVNPVPTQVLEKFAHWRSRKPVTSQFGAARGLRPFTVEDEMKGHE
jgi:predicted nucleic acid-binding protein